MVRKCDLDSRAARSLLSSLPRNKAGQVETDKTGSDNEDDTEDDDDACFFAGPVAALGEGVGGFADGDGCHFGGYLEGNVSSNVVLR